MPTKAKALRKKEWFDDDSFWREMYPFMFPSQRFADAEKQVRKALALAKPKGRSALDLCCGPGRFTIALARKGFAVTGVDRTKYLLDKARAKARDARVKVEWVQEDMRDFLRPNSFALVLSMFTSFGYFEDRREDRLVLENIFASLKPGGVFLVELMGKERLAKIFQSPITTILPDGGIWIDRHEIFDDWTRVRNEWLVVRNGKTKSFKFTLNIYSGLELRERMEGAGFTGVKLYGTLDGTEYGSNAERLIAIGRKPSSNRKAVPAGRAANS
jgi:SAM-dependent methyltransferase